MQSGFVFNTRSTGILNNIVAGTGYDGIGL
jgi:hypothetical protein